MNAVSLATHPMEVALERAQAEQPEASVARWLRFAHVRSSDVVELQALNVTFGNAARTYVAHASSSSEVLRLLDESKRFDCPGVYWIANRVDPAVATRLGIDKWNPAPKGASTTDRDITHRTVLFVDIDAERPTGTSSTAAELGAAVAVAAEVHDWLAGVLGREVVLGYGASGNGRGVYVALADLLETDAGVRVKAILTGLDHRFSTPGAKVDTSVSDAKRLVPAFGTMKKKGAPGLAERPHRRTAFVCAGAVGRVEVPDLDRVIEALRGEVDDAGRVAIERALGIKATPAKAAVAASSPPSGDSPFARANAVDVEDVLSWLGSVEGGRVRCPGCGESDRGVVVINNGLKCSHARCAGKGVRDGFRTPVDVVCEIQHVEPREAVAALAERFGFEGFRTRAGAPPPVAPPAAVPLIAPAERVRALAKLGPVVRLESGIPMLDKACRGGVPTRRLVVVGGAPGAGKTTLVTNWAWRWSKLGIPVAVLAIDEDAVGFLMRTAQMESIHPELVEERDPHTLEHLAGLVAATPLILIDADDAAGSVEKVAEYLAAQAKGAPAVLVVDSLQTARALGTDAAGSPRERVDAVVRALKAARDRYGFLVVATCELARGSYRSKAQAEQINDLAAFKESGGIEYAAQTALVLRSVPDEPSLVDVSVPKNRAYRKDPFRLRLDHATTLLTEVDMPLMPEGRAARSDTLENDASELRKLLVERPGINGLQALRNGLRAKRVNIGNDRIGAGLAYLRNRGELDNRGTERRPALWLRTVQEAVGDDE